MEEVKRVVIISPEKNIQKGLEVITQGYLKRSFVGYAHEAEIQMFGSINESYQNKAQVGRGGEVLVIIDEASFLPAYKPHSSLKYTRMLIDSLKHFCSERKIPYLAYKGEMKTNLETSLLRKLDELTNEVSRRLEARDFFT